MAQAFLVAARYPWIMEHLTAGPLNRATGLQRWDAAGCWLLLGWHTIVCLLRLPAFHMPACRIRVPTPVSLVKCQSLSQRQALQAFAAGAALKWICRSQRGKKKKKGIRMTGGK